MDETASDPSLYTADAYAVKIVDKRPLYLRKTILEDLDDINERLARKIKDWELKVKATSFREGSMVLFKSPLLKQFSVATSRPVYLNDKEKLIHIRQDMMLVPPGDTRDQLLGFLAEYQEHCHFLDKGAKQVRDDMLIEVIEWLRSDNINFQKVGDIRLDLIINTNEEVRKYYLETLSNMEKLRRLRFQLAPRQSLEASSKDALKGSEKEQTIKEGLAESGLASEFAEPEKLQDNIKDLQNFIKKSDIFSNAALIPVKNRIEELRKKQKVEEKDLKNLLKAVIRKEVDMKLVKYNHSLIQKDIAKLKARVRELQNEIDNEQKAAQATALAPKVNFQHRGTQVEDTRYSIWSAEVVPSAVPQIVTESTSAGESTEEIAYDLEMFDFTPLYQRTSDEAAARAAEEGKEVSPETKRKDTVSTEPSEKGLVPPEKSQAKRITKTRAPRLSTDQRSKTLSVEEEEEEVTEGASTKFRRKSRLIASLRKPSLRRPSLRKKSVVEKPGVKAADPVKSVTSDVKEVSSVTMVQRKPSIQLAEEEQLQQMETVNKIILAYLDQAGLNLHSMLLDVVSQRTIARQETQSLKELEQTITLLEKRISKCLEGTGNEQHLELVKEDDSLMTISHRVPGTHECQFCFCHDKDTQTDLLSTLANAVELRESIQHCSAYISALGTTEMGYVDTYDILTDILSAMDFIKNEEVWDIDPEERVVTQLEGDDHDVMNLVKTTANIPQRLKELRRHAAYVSDATRILFEEAMNLLSQSKLRLEQTDAQTEQLYQLEKIMSRLETLTHKGGLTLEGLLTRANYLKTAHILQGCACPYCNCLNKEIEETQTRIMPLSSLEKENTFINNVAIAGHGLKKLLKYARKEFKKQKPTDPDFGLIEDALGQMNEMMHLIVNQLQEYETETGEKTLYILDGGGWRKTSLGSIATASLISMPEGSSHRLSQMIGLREEFLDPTYYKRHRDEMVRSGVREKADRMTKKRFKKVGREVMKPPAKPLSLKAKVQFPMMKKGEARMKMLIDKVQELHVKTSSDLEDESEEVSEHVRPKRVSRKISHRKASKERAEEIERRVSAVLRRKISPTAKHRRITLEKQRKISQEMEGAVAEEDQGEITEKRRRWMAKEKQAQAEGVKHKAPREKPSESGLLREESKELIEPRREDLEHMEESLTIQPSSGSSIILRRSVSSVTSQVSGILAIQPEKASSTEDVSKKRRDVHWQEPSDELLRKKEEEEMESLEREKLQMQRDSIAKELAEAVSEVSAEVEEGKEPGAVGEMGAKAEVEEGEELKAMVEMEPGPVQEVVVTVEEGKEPEEMVEMKPSSSLVLVESKAERVKEKRVVKLASTINPPFVSETEPNYFVKSYQFETPGQKTEKPFQMWPAIPKLKQLKLKTVQKLKQKEKGRRMDTQRPKLSAEKRWAGAKKLFISEVPKIAEFPPPTAEAALEDRQKPELLAVSIAIEPVSDQVVREFPLPEKKLIELPSDQLLPEEKLLESPLPSDQLLPEEKLLESPLPSDQLLPEEKLVRFSLPSDQLPPEKKLVEFPLPSDQLLPEKQLVGDEEKPVSEELALTYEDVQKPKLSAEEKLISEEKKVPLVEREVKELPLPSPETQQRKPSPKERLVKGEKTLISLDHIVRELPLATIKGVAVERPPAVGEVSFFVSGREISRERKLEELIAEAERETEMEGRRQPMKSLRAMVNRMSARRRVHAVRPPPKKRPLSGLFQVRSDQETLRRTTSPVPESPFRSLVISTLSEEQEKQVLERGKTRARRRRKPAQYGMQLVRNQIATERQARDQIATGRQARNQIATGRQARDQIATGREARDQIAIKQQAPRLRHTTSPRSTSPLATGASPQPLQLSDISIMSEEQKQILLKTSEAEARKRPRPLQYGMDIVSDLTATERQVRELLQDRPSGDADKIVSPGIQARVDKEHPEHAQRSTFPVTTVVLSTWSEEQEERFLQLKEGKPRPRLRPLQYGMEIVRGQIASKRQARNSLSLLNRVIHGGNLPPAGPGPDGPAEPATPLVDSCHDSKFQQIWQVQKADEIWTDGMPKILSPMEKRARCVPLAHAPLSGQVFEVKVTETGVDFPLTSWPQAAAAAEIGPCPQEVSCKPAASSPPLLKYFEELIPMSMKKDSSPPHEPEIPVQPKTVSDYGLLSETPEEEISIPEDKEPASPVILSVKHEDDQTRRTPLQRFFGRLYKKASLTAQPEHTLGLECRQLCPVPPDTKPPHPSPCHPLVRSIVQSSDQPPPSLRRPYLRLKELDDLTLIEEQGPTSIRITPSSGVVRSYFTDGHPHWQSLSGDFHSQQSTEQSHIGASIGLKTKRIKARYRRPKGPAPPAYYLASPYHRDRFFFEVKRSLNTLNVKAPPPDPDAPGGGVTYPRFRMPMPPPRLLPALPDQKFPLNTYPSAAEMDVYKRLGRRQVKFAELGKTSPRETMATLLVPKLAMKKHLQQGWQQMQARQHEFRAEDCTDLLQSILLFDIPGINHLQKDYTGLLTRPTEGSASLEETFNENISNNFSQCVPQQDLKT